MELIIKLPDHIYENVKTGDLNRYIIDTVTVAIAKGTPLPKGHDRLIEADEVLFQSIRDYCGPGKAYEILKSAKTIIEADKG